MRPFLRNILGVAFIIAAVGGLLFSLFGLFGVWYYKTPVGESLTNDLQLLGRALTATEDGLVSADSSLNTSIKSMRALQDTLTATSGIVEASVPMIDTLTQLTRADLPNMVTNAKTSLEAAQESAKIIDAVLTALVNIPFVPKDIYNPPVPLHVALEQVSESMDPLPSALDTIETSMASAAGSLGQVKGELELMADDIAKIRTQLEAAQRITGNYQSLTSTIQGRVDRLEQRLPALLNLGAWVLTLILLWMMVVQLALFVLAWDLLKGRK
jgi:hypothetical protein